MRCLFNLIPVTVVLGIVSTCAYALSVADAKSLQDKQPTAVAGKVVIYTAPDFFYVQDADRSGGIRIAKINHGLAVGDIVDVAGMVDTNSDFERFIIADVVSQQGSDITAIRPFYLRNQALGGSNWNYNSTTGAGQLGISAATGTNNIGQLVRVQGKVMSGAPGDTASIHIDDGSGIHVEIVLPPSVTSPGYGAMIAATGVLSCKCEHQQIWGVYKPEWYDNHYGRLNPSTPEYRDFQRRVILANSVQEYEPGPEWRYIDEMVYIPAGNFLAGHNGTENYRDQNGGTFLWLFPQHTVYLSGYWIGKHEVTRGEYRRFMEAGGYSNPAYWSRKGWEWKTGINRIRPDYWPPTVYYGALTFTQTDSHPVIGVSYYECEAFCNWAGGHLPTKAQWEKAARWTGSHANAYPWGDTWDPEKCNNIDDTRYPGTAPVGSYPSGISPYGCHDMAGNVWEWCKDWYGASYYSRTPSGGWLDPQGPPKGNDPWCDPNIINTRVASGGSWGNDDGHIWCASTYTMTDWYEYRSHIAVGFRIAR